MINKNAIGRPQKVTYTVLGKLEDALEHGTSVSEACCYAGISRDTFYRYFRDEEIFASKIEAARNRFRVKHSLRLTWVLSNRKKMI